MTPAQIRFTADGMLQSLGTWLRLLGYDCMFDSRQRGRQLLEQATAEDRVFLTRNAHLADNLPHGLLERAAVCYVEAEHLPGQLAEVAERFALDTESHTFTRCLICNVPLHPADRAAEAPADVNECWRCPVCQKIFWRGSHVRNSLDRLRRWLGDVSPQ
jgi:uncharacterized protein